jgi:hypothetical protein
MSEASAHPIRLPHRKLVMSLGRHAKIAAVYRSNEREQVS